MESLASQAALPTAGWKAGAGCLISSSVCFPVLKMKILVMSTPAVLLCSEQPE